MRVAVLGCHGGETPQHLPTSLLVDDTVAIDAGSICRALSIEAQLRIDDVLVGHAHMDHVKDLALLAEQVLLRRDTPVTVHCGPETAKILKQHLFNDKLWPDFTVLPSKSKPVLKIKTQRPNRKFKTSAGHEVIFVPVEHPIESMGMVVQGESGAFLFSSDTGPTEKLWKTAAKTQDLRAAFIELSFPNSMQDLADLAGHLTPYSLAQELSKLPQNLGVYLYHLKPSHFAETRRDLRALRDERLCVLAPGDAIAI